ncbi:MAG: hypothetical protein ACXV4A_14010 [Actinomycetes bacterium]
MTATEHTAASAASIAAEAAPTIVNSVLNRSKAMQLMHEDLARAHSAYHLEELLRHERSRRVARAHRAARRAEEAALRARRLLDLAVLR